MRSQALQQALQNTGSSISRNSKIKMKHCQIYTRLWSCSAITSEWPTQRKTTEPLQQHSRTSQLIMRNLRNLTLRPLRMGLRVDLSNMSAFAARIIDSENASILLNLDAPRTGSQILK